jgi:cation:H+ antiporter
VLITLLWLLGLLVVRRARRSLPWRQTQRVDEGQRPAREQDRQTNERISTAKSASIFTVAALVTLIAGVVLEATSNAIADDLGWSGVLFAATVLAAATALPEISTGLAAVKNGDYELAVSDIFGGNAFLPVLFLLATVLSGQAVLPQAHNTDIYLSALGMLLSLVYAAGLLFRPQRRIARMGVDSLVVLLLYTAGIAGLFAIAA